MAQIITFPMTAIRASIFADAPATYDPATGHIGLSLAANSIMGNNTGSSGTPLALTASQVKSLLAIGQADVAGLTTASTPIFSGVALSGNTSSVVGMYTYNSTPTTNSYIAGFRARGASGSPTAVMSGDRLFHFGAYGYGTTGFSVGTAALIEVYAAENWSDAAQGTYLQFTTTPIGSTYASRAVRLITRASGNVTIGSATEITSALLQVSSTTKGFLPPVMTTTQKNAIGTPAAGLLVYDATLNKLCVHTESAWQTITSV